MSDLHEKLEIIKMLTVSTAHVKQKTFEQLMMDNIGFPVYEKIIPNNGTNYGLYIHIDPEIDREPVPDELMPLIDLALNNDCDILCLDGDGPQLEEYPVFKWSN